MTRIGAALGDSVFGAVAVAFGLSFVEQFVTDHEAGCSLGGIGLLRHGLDHHAPPAARRSAIR